MHRRTCPLCEAMCGLEVHVDDGQVVLIRGDRDDVWSKGYLCPKGTTIGALHHDPDRLREPLVREGDTWREVTWHEAFARCEELIAGVLERHGRDAIAVYLGNPLAHNASLGRYTGLFIGLSQVANIYSPGPMDQWPRNVVSLLLYGNMWRIPTPDLHRTQHWLLLGGNPQASQGSLLACADVLGQIDAIRARGGKVVVVDPRRTGTADRADEWVPIRPGTDAALLAAMVQTLFAEDLTDLGALADVVDGVDEVRTLTAAFTPERVAATCGIPADTIRRMAREVAAAPSAAVYGRIGTCTQEFGTLASWLLDVVNVLTGNLDRPGGMMFATPLVESVTAIPPPDLEQGFVDRSRSRVRGIPEVLGQYPLSCLAEEMDTPGEGQLRALVTVAGNPALSGPEAARLDAALGGLEAMISVDNYLNETTRHAHVVLPGLSALEQPHLDDLILLWTVRSWARYSAPVFPRDDGRPEEWEILVRLGAMLAGLPSEGLDVQGIDDGYVAALAELWGVDPAVASSGSPGKGPERLFDVQIRCGPFGDRYGERPDGLTLEKLRAATDGLDLGPMQPQLRELLAVVGGRLALAPPYIAADLARLEARLDRDGDGLVLVSRRHLRSNNSWLHNMAVLVKGRDRCTLLIHPDDAAAAGVVDGAAARVSSTAGSIVVPVEVSDEMAPGVVCLPHGWGHDKEGTRLAVAREHAGVNYNELTPGDLYDPLSNTAVVNGIPVEVAPV